MFLCELTPHDFNFRESIVCFNVGQDSPTQRFFSQIFLNILSFLWFLVLLLFYLSQEVRLYFSPALLTHN